MKIKTGTSYKKTFIYTDKLGKYQLDKVKNLAKIASTKRFALRVANQSYTKIASLFYIKIVS